MRGHNSSPNDFSEQKRSIPLKIPQSNCREMKVGPIEPEVVCIYM